MAEEQKNKTGGDSFKKVYDDATYFVDSMVKEYRVFPMILGLMRDGKASIELKKRYMLRAIDETWVNIIEDTIPCLDVLIRNPSKFIEEREELVPIELSRNISPRSFQHLSQHTNLISKIEGDKITPSKILNVFREETIQTYENKFVNTLINRLYTFVGRRYEIAKKAGQDEKTTSLEFKDDFTHDDVNVKMQFRMEISESTEGKGEKVEKNYTYTTDLWRRVTKLYDVVSTYAASPFVQEMGHSYIRPPVMRTNAILKNKNLRQCLALWQFIESYESAGYSMLVQEDLEKVDDEYVRELYSTLALQYLIFRHNIQNEFDAENVLASDLTDEELRPRMISEFSEDRKKDFDITVPGEKKEPERRQPLPSMIRYGTLTPEDKMMLESLDAALDAAEIMRQNEPERPPLPEPEPEKTEEEILAELMNATPEEPPKEEAAEAKADSGEAAVGAVINRPQESTATEEAAEATEEPAEEAVEETVSEEPAEPAEEEKAEEPAEPWVPAEDTSGEETEETAAEETAAEETAFADIVASVAAEVAAEAAAEAEEAAETEADSGQRTADSEETTTEEPAEEAVEETVSEEPAEPAKEEKAEEPAEPAEEEKAEEAAEAAADSGQQTADSGEAAAGAVIDRPQESTATGEAADATTAEPAEPAEEEKTEEPAEETPAEEIRKTGAGKKHRRGKAMARASELANKSQKNKK